MKTEKNANRSILHSYLQVILLGACIIGAGIAVGFAQSRSSDPSPIVYEGFLERDGEAANGTFPMRFHLFRNATGSEGPLWSSSTKQVSVVDGRFSVVLGDDNPVGRDELWNAAWPGAGLFVGMQVGGVWLNGRQELFLGGKGAPSGMVAFFDRTSCPQGWSPYTAGDGRALVGATSGSIGRRVGQALGPTETRVHSHRIAARVTQVSPEDGAHQHAWALFDGMNWSTWNNDSSPVPTGLSNWREGLGDEGEGIFPLYATGPNRRLYTAPDGSHTHTVPAHDTEAASEDHLMPYLQLRICRKD